MTNYNFQRFNRENILGDTRVSLTLSKAIRFPSSFCKTNSLYKFKYVILFFDSINFAIGMKPTIKAEKGAFKLTNETGGAISISVVSFLKANKIDPAAHAGRYEWKKEDIAGIGELFIIEIKK